MLYHEMIESPIGRLVLIANNKALLEIKFHNSPVTPPYSNKANWIINHTKKELDEYFLGKREEFTMPLDPIGTEFQKKTWQKLLEIPYGTTISYQELALKMGDARKSRAVGSANGKNPIPIIIPCHRVINKNGKLGGYAGGLDVKEFLLNLESAN